MVASRTILAAVCGLEAAAGMLSDGVKSGYLVEDVMKRVMLWVRRDGGCCG